MSFRNIKKLLGLKETKKGRRNLKKKLFYKEQLQTMVRWEQTPIVGWK